jgi:2-methylisocitrate lyase-like PEP mutase family enzyme
VHKLGFQAAYIGSYATGATKYGVADVGYIGLEDMANQVRRLAPLVSVPVIVDGEGGWDNPLHVARAVRVLERAGAAATHIADHVFGKHITMRPTLLSVDQAVDKIKAALDARDSTDFMIIGRTYITWSDWRLECFSGRHSCGTSQTGGGRPLDVDAVADSVIALLKLSG